MDRNFNDPGGELTWTVVERLASFLLMGTGKKAAPIPALAASVAAFVITAITLVMLLARGKPSVEPAPGGLEARPDVECSSNVTFLRVAVTVLLAFCSAGSLLLGIGVLDGFASAYDIWEFMKIAALAEAFALGYYRVIKRH